MLSAETFSITKFAINPGLRQCFPFLSQLAQNYEQYRFKYIIFKFYSTSSNALDSLNTALGTVLMAVQYDVLSADFVSKYEMLNYTGSVSSRPSRSFRLVVRPPAYGLMWIRGGQAPANADMRLYDLANFYFAADGSQAASAVGELHVEYEVELYKPKLSDSLGWDTDMAIWLQTSGVAAATPLGDGPGKITAASMDVQAGADATLSLPPAGIAIAYDTKRIYFNPSYGGLCYLVYLSFRGAGAAATTASGISAQNLDIKNLFLDFGRANLGNEVTLLQTEMVIIYSVKIGESTTQASFLEFDPDGVYPTAPVTLNITIVEIPPFTPTNAFEF